jgi:pyruvate dehydrogenase E2 component (dihydrolipoamide acetyltransferase)
MAEFLMPSLGADMDAGTLVAWRKKPGDVVKRGEIIAEVETEKGIIEVEVFTDGVVDRLLVDTGTKVPVGMPLALIRGAGEAAPAERAPMPPAERAPMPPAERARVSPAARRRASELGVDLAKVVGTGPDGVISMEDVERAGPAKAATLEATPRPPPDDAKARMRQAIAAAMSRSKREIPHYYVSDTVDAGPLTTWLEAWNARVPPPERLIASALFLKAVSLALRDFPSFNGFFADGRFSPGEDVNVGAAIALRGGGLVAPAIHQSDRASLPELMGRLRDLVTRARSGSLRSSEMAGATITVTSLGDRGTESVIGVIYPPQVAIVGFGRILERPWVVGNTVVPRPVVRLSLAADHRVTDGHEGALFLAAVGEKLAHPETL